VAKTKIPDPLARRHLVERELPPAQALRLAEAYLAQGRELEAVDFLRKAGARDRLLALRESALAAGDAFLLRAVSAALGEPPDAAAWQALAEAAAAAGKQRYAADARRQVTHGGEG
jgi:hypothetical protein